MKSSVWPSGAAAATDLAPMLVPPPVRFSTMTFWPSFSGRYCTITRASESTGPPALNGTTILMVWLG